jgi:hypothetical protein
VSFSPIRPIVLTDLLREKEGNMEIRMKGKGVSKGNNPKVFLFIEIPVTHGMTACCRWIWDGYKELSVYILIFKLTL